VRRVKNLLKIISNPKNRFIITVTQLIPIEKRAAREEFIENYLKPKKPVYHYCYATHSH